MHFCLWETDFCLALFVFFVSRIRTTLCVSDWRYIYSSFYRIKLHSIWITKYQFYCIINDKRQVVYATMMTMMMSALLQWICWMIMRECMEGIKNPNKKTTKNCPQWTKKKMKCAYTVRGPCVVAHSWNDFGSSKLLPARTPRLDSFLKVFFFNAF